MTRGGGGTLEGYKRNQFLGCCVEFNLQEPTVFVHFSSISAFGNSLQGVFHVRNTPEWFTVFWLTSLQSTTKRMAADPSLATKK